MLLESVACQTDRRAAT